MKLKGLRTKLSGLATAIIPIAAAAGFQIDPESITKLLNDFGLAAAFAQIVPVSMVLHYRDQAQEPEEPSQEMIEKSSPDFTETPTQEELNESLEHEIETV